MDHYWVKDNRKRDFIDIIRLFDISLILISALIAYYVYFNSIYISEICTLSAIFGSFLFVVIGKGLGIYKLGKFKSIKKQLSDIFITMFIVMAINSFITVAIQHDLKTSLMWGLYWLLFSFIALIIERLICSFWFNRLIKSGAMIRKVILVGNTNRTAKLLRRINDPERKNTEALGIYLPNNKKDKEVAGLLVINNIDDLVKICYEEEIDDVIITYEMDSTDHMEDILADLREVPCNVRYCLPAILFEKGQPAHVWGAPVIPIYRRPLSERSFILKRFLDIVVAILMIIGLSPIFLVTAFILKVIERGDILFRQERGGFMGNIFKIYKFRSMKVADSGLGEVKQAQRNDPRITKVGAILRKTSIDELPQLINVLKGEMSIVGPRPHAVSHNDHYNQIIDSYAARNRVKPGITGWAQVNGHRGETDTVDKMKSRIDYDLYYIENWSIFMDIKIILLTPVSLFSKNIY